MIYLSLFWEFLKIGMFSFGGAYGAIPLIQQSVLERGWMDAGMFANILAISESTPGPIMVNTATYIGSTQAGVLGAAVATLGVITPSFVIILLVAVLLRRALKHPAVQAVLQGVKPCLMGVILATGLYMAFGAVAGDLKHFSLDVRALVILTVLLICTGAYPKLRKKELPPILLIVISAVLGMVLYGFVHYE